MSDTPEPEPTPAEQVAADTAVAKAEAAATRRRWISLAELVAVAGLIIGAVTLYLNWSDRREDRAAQAQSQAAEGKARAIVTLTGAVTDDGQSIALTDPAHTVSGATVRFPSSLGVAQQDAMPGPRIRAGWFDDALLRLTDRGSDEREGRLPVLITTTWWDGDTRRQNTALYDVLWRTEGRMLKGRKLELTGLALNDRAATAAALDAAWKRERPKP